LIAVVPPGLGQLVAVAAGGDYWQEDSAHSLALKSDGRVVAWGYDDGGELTPPEGLENVIGIAAGRVHGLALKRDGTVAAWGGNLKGQCLVPPNLRDVVAIDAGGFYSLALKSDGSVVTWGENFNGEFWEESTVPAGLCDVVAISAGRFHSMALKSDGTVVSWGYNLDGQTDVPADLSDVVGIAAGGFHSLALKRDGSVVAWGANGSGQATIPVAARAQVKSISAGLLHSLALRQTTGLPEITSSPRISAAPGVELSHQVVVANAVPSQFTATGLPAGLSIDPVGGLISGAVTGAARRSVQIQVDTNRGRLFQVMWIHVFQGLSPTGISASPAEVMENSPAGSVVGTLSATDPDAGDLHTFELVHGIGSLDNGRFRISGNQLFARARIDRDYETDPESFSIRVRARDSWLNPFEAVIVLRLLDDRQEDADGDGLSEEEEDLAGTSDAIYDMDGDGFGDGFERDRGTVPTDATDFPTGRILVAWGSRDKAQTTVPAGLDGVIGLAAGRGHNLALKSDGTVAAWGWNGDGQCGVPLGLADIVAVEAGDRHSVALKRDGRVIAWGNDEDRQAAVPSDLAGVVTIAAGSRHNLALRNDGTVVAWGANEYGQASVPPGLGDVIAIAAGGYHSLALKSDGSVVAWGWSGSVAVPTGAERVIAISAGGFHSLALRSDGSVVAWGDNAYGQSNVPGWLSGVVDLKAGWLHSTALKGDGTLIAWGSNTNQQAAVPIEARNAHALAVGVSHNLALCQTDGFPEITTGSTILGWPGQAVDHQVTIRNATAEFFTEMGLPDGLAIDPVTGVISGMVAHGARRSVRISVDTDVGRLSRILWLDTVDGRPPTAITLTGEPVSLLENSPPGRFVGTLAAMDPDAGDFHTFSVIVTAGSANPFCFGVSGKRLVVSSGDGIDFENGSGRLTIRVRAYDSTWNYHDQDFAIRLLDDRTEDGDNDGASQAMEEDVLATSDSKVGDFSTSDADHDGIPALIEHAFNLNLRVPDAGRQLGGAGSTSGLPLIWPVADEQGKRHLRMEYLRRIGSGLNYVPEFSSSLDPDNWTAAMAKVKITPVSAEWERCVVDDTELTPSPAVRFGRIAVCPAGAGVRTGNAPTAIALTSLIDPGGPVTLLENSRPGTVVGILSATDADAADRHAFDVVVTGGSPNPFNLVALGNQLVLASGAGIDFEPGSENLTIKVRASDSSMNYLEREFIIKLLDDRTEDADKDGASEAMEEDVLFTSDSDQDDFSTADGDHDGVSTLVEHAFNLNLQAADAGHYLGGADSISGLPLVRSVTDAQGRRRLRMEYLRRTGSGLSYVPEFSNSLGPAAWTPATHAVEVVRVTEEWERCVVDDYEFTPSPAIRFGRIGVRMLASSLKIGGPPTALALTSAAMPEEPVSLRENSVAGTVVGDLTVTDPDAGDSHVFEVTVTSGSSNPYSLATRGCQLVLVSGTDIDFENGSGDLTIKVEVTDSSQNSYVRNFTIQLIDDRSEDADGDGMDQALEEDFLFTSDSHRDDFSTADADGDGISTLIEYAFNLDLQAADAGRYLGGADSTSGLPVIRSEIDAQGRPCLRMEYLSRIGSGLSYVPEFSSGLGPADWKPVTEGIEVIPVDFKWERCVVVDREFTVSPQLRFGRVRVSP
jgi:alpha-tubulin suppressor-like RCC1 family protein